MVTTEVTTFTVEPPPPFAAAAKQPKLSGEAASERTSEEAVYTITTRYQEDYEILLKVRGSAYGG